MNTFRIVLQEFVGLFVDDGSLAIAILGIVVAAVFLFPLLPLLPTQKALVILAALLAVLVENVWRTARQCQK